MCLSENHNLQNSIKLSTTVAYKRNKSTPMMPEEYKVSLIVERDNSPTTKVWILWEKWLY